MRQQAAGGRTRKHTAAGKHAGTGKHHPRRQRAAPAAQGRKATAVAKPAAHAKPRQLSIGDVACCTAEALAASLRLTGRPVGADDVLALYWRTASGPDTGAAILATLEAACESGLAGTRPVSFAPVDPGDPAAVILGLELPGPHAVLEHGGRWWSWGEPWAPGDFPDAVAEEAWAVTWP